MKCLICKFGIVKPGKATVMLERKNSILVIKNVPARVCSNCGEEYVNEKISSRLLKKASKWIRKGKIFDVHEFLAA